MVIGAYNNNFKNALNTLLDVYVNATIKPSLYNNPPWYFGREGCDVATEFKPIPSLVKMTLSTKPQKSLSLGLQCVKRVENFLAITIDSKNCSYSWKPSKLILIRLHKSRKSTVVSFTLAYFLEQILSLGGATELGQGRNTSHVVSAQGSAPTRRHCSG